MYVLSFKAVLYLVMMIATFFIVREIYYVRRRSPPPKLWDSMRIAAGGYRPRIEALYTDDHLKDAFSFAGLPEKMTAWSYRFWRDIAFMVAIVGMHAGILINKTYPTKLMLIIAVLYLASLTRSRYFPVRLLLSMAGKEKNQQKNNEVTQIYMLLVNDYQVETEGYYKSVYDKLKEYREYTTVLGNDMDQMLSDYRIEGNAAFKAIGEVVGTKEAKALSDILIKISESNPEQAVDLLEKNYETFLDFRRQRRRKKLKLNHYIGVVLASSATLTVVNFAIVVTNVYQGTYVFTQ
ncbi:hypothetical protein ABEW34_21630 [Paenibacillus algorifonticola]|uniref:hypothetical protein n=1 Tax=Paenibacillus algorifonticola TaxID=684063 RepID=UPI003D29764B